MNGNKKLIVFLVTGILLSLFVGCGQEEKVYFAENDITLGTENTLSSIAQTELAKAILEENGYTANIEIQQYDKLWMQLDHNEVNAIVCSWLPDIHRSEYTKYKNEIEDLGENCEDLKLGLLVPRYVPIMEISELKLYGKKFDQTIYLPEEGEEMLEQVEKVLKKYQLNFTIKKVSETKLTEALDESMHKGSWVLLVGWTPNWIVQEYDLRFLEDSLKTFDNYQNIHTVVNKRYMNRNKDISNLLDQYYLYNFELNQLLAHIRHEKEIPTGEAVKTWLADNPQIKERIEK